MNSLAVLTGESHPAGFGLAAMSGGERNQQQRPFLQTPQHEALAAADRREGAGLVGPGPAQIGGDAHRHVAVDGIAAAQRQQAAAFEFDHAGVDPGDGPSPVPSCVNRGAGLPSPGSDHVFPPSELRCSAVPPLPPGTASQF